MYADFTILSEDYFTIHEKQINNLKAVLTVVGGTVVYGDKEYKAMNPQLPEVIPNWSPAKYYGGYQNK